MAKTAVVQDPKTYVAYRGVVELKYGIENETVEWRKDLYDYVREDMKNHDGGRFEPDFCTKDKQTNKRYWFDCLVCPCVLYRDENLVFHVNGQKHQKKVTEKIANAVVPSRSAKGNRRTHEPVRSINRSARSEFLADIIENSPNYPFLGLRYITEHQNPSNPDKDRIYTCSLKGCKSTWGDARTLFNHLKSDKNKHNKNYLVEHYSTHVNLTREQIYNKSQDVYEKEYKGKRAPINEIKMERNLKSYNELKNRDINWSESKNKIKEESATDLKHYVPQNLQERVHNLEETFDSMQTQIALTLEKVQDGYFQHSMAARDKVSEFLPIRVHQSKTMLDILQRHQKHIQERVPAFKEKYVDMAKKIDEIKYADAVANSHRRMYDGPDDTGMEFEDKDKPKKPLITELNRDSRDREDSGIDHRMEFEDDKGVKTGIKRRTERRDNREEVPEKTKKLETQKKAMTDFKQAIKVFVERCLVRCQFGPREPTFEDVRERIASKISKMEIDAFEKRREKYEERGESYGYEYLELNDRQKAQIENYVRQKVKQIVK